MINLEKISGEMYQDKYGQYYYVENRKGAYKVRNKEGRIIQIDDIKLFMKEVVKVKGYRGNNYSDKRIDEDIEKI